ncbi:MAG: hypothetical protein RL136_2246 [Planctomycetota bacterium]
MRGNPYCARMSGRIDWLVITAANRRQARAYASQVAPRAEHGPLSSVAGIVVSPDACDARIGSGAATVLALVRVAQQLARRKKAASIAELFGGVRVVMLHSGGDSRRLPMYAAEGKLFATLPMPGAGGRCGALLDALVDDLATLEPRAGGEVLVAAGDALIGIARDPVRLDGDGVIGVAQRAGVERAVRHGVYVAAREGEDDRVHAFLQKPGEGELAAAGAVDARGIALVDTGLLSLDPAAVGAMLAGAGVTLACDADGGCEIVVAKGGLADRASRAELPPIDLYREILMALPAATTREAYLAACADGRTEAVLAPYFDAMRGTPFRVRVASLSEFLHIGSTAEVLSSLVGTAAACRDFGIDPDRRMHGDTLLLDASVRELALASGHAAVDRSAVVSLELGGGNVVVGVHAERVSLPAGVSLFAIPQLDEEPVHVACGLHDDFKTPFAQGGTIFGEALDAWCARAGLDARTVATGDGTLWDARLWCEAPAKGGDPLALVRWMWEGGAPPQAWRDAARCSLREAVERADLEEIALERDRIARGWVCAHPVTALAEALDDVDARQMHELLVAQEDPTRLAVLMRGAEELLSTPSPIARAHGAATLAEVAGAASAEGRSMRDIAFRCVGEAVLGHFELPSAPARAAILHDQAVWTSMPVRVDLAGGWSDTPPICNEVGGSVVNVAVTLRGQLPIQVTAKLEEEPVIRITSTDAGQTRVIRSMADLAQRGDPTRWSSLAESALVLAGIAPSDPNASLQEWLQAVGGGLSLTMFSAVPKGSGLGTSSILGAATIQCLDRVLGRERGVDGLFAATSALEQMLGTRGGWQDQVGGTIGGFKLASTVAGVEQHPQVDRIEVPSALVEELGERALLYFTGERRMAKNILETVVWNWLVREPSATKAVERLRANAARMRGALASGDARGVVAEIAEYMKRKRQIDPGSCPKAFDDLAARWSGALDAWCFAGAGGGGFMLLVARDAASARGIRAEIERDPPHARARAFDFEVDPVGMRCAVL